MKPYFKEKIDKQLYSIAKSLAHNLGCTVNREYFVVLDSQARAKYIRNINNIAVQSCLSEN